MHFPKNPFHIDFILNNHQQGKGSSIKEVGAGVNQFGRMRAGVGHKQGVHKCKIFCVSKTRTARSYCV